MPTEIGAINVRRSAWIDAGPPRVWQEFETFERFQAWYGVGHDLMIYEPREGGRLEFESEPYRFGGRILVFDPSRELTFEDGFLPRPPGAPVLLITYRLTPHRGGTHVEFFVHGFEAIGDAWPGRLEGLEKGWTTLQLRHLRDVVEGRVQKSD